jgi:uncharacterized protein
MPRGMLHYTAILAVACSVGVASGLLGVGGGVFMVPLLVLLFHFDQHAAQGTNLLALVPPTGLFAFLEYYHAGHVNVLVGVLLMPGVFFGGIVGGKLAHRLPAIHMRRAFASFLFILGIWQIVAAWRR